MNLLVPLLLLLRRADGERVARNAVGFDQVSDGTTIRPQIWVSTATAGENIRWRVIVSPHPLRPPRCVDVLWGCARKTTHLRSLTPSDGQNSDLQSKCLSWGLYFYICAALHKWAWPWPMMSNKKCVIGGAIVQSRLCPSVRCQKFTAAGVSRFSKARDEWMKSPTDYYGLLRLFFTHWFIYDFIW